MSIEEHIEAEKTKMIYIFTIMVASFCGTMGGVWSLKMGIQYHDLLTIVGSAVGTVVGTAFIVFWLVDFVKKFKSYRHYLAVWYETMPMDDVEQLLKEMGQKYQEIVDNGLTQNDNAVIIVEKSKKGGKNVTKNRRD